MVDGARTLADLHALDARDQLDAGTITSEQLVEACLARINEREAEIGAWVVIDRDLALAQAADADERRRSGAPLGPLDGLPVGVKDIIDTADLPTENGTVLDAGRRPGKDATIVSRLRAAGAVILGKTVTTECAFLSPSKTRNPRNLEHTPGGSSSGSAASVAAAMVPLSIGTQTGGSVIRPAAFCGVVGFKPSHGLIPRTGVLRHSSWLDTIGTFGRTIEDVALLTDTLAGHDPGDADTRPAAPPNLLGLARSEPPAAPRLAFVKTPAWKDITPDSVEGFSALANALGGSCEEVELPEHFGDAPSVQRHLAFVGMAKTLGSYYDRGKDRLGDPLRSAVETGRKVTGLDYLTAIDRREAMNGDLDDIFDRYDAILTPAAPGEAPHSLRTTGSPDFCVLWTLTGVPAIVLPLLEGANGLPIGVQLVGRRGSDGALLRTARWLVKFVAGLPNPKG